MRLAFGAARSKVFFGVACSVSGLLGLASCDLDTPPERQRGAIVANQAVVISQIYGGAGSNGPFQNDFVELFNKSDTPVNLTGWSVQYASAAGTGNFVATALAGGTLQPGQYHLVRMASGTGTAPLPSGDTLGSTAMSGTTAKVILASVATSLPCNGGSTPCSATDDAKILDLVGYGGANYFDGSPTATLTASTAAIRNGGGCSATHNNNSDFSAATPTPRNTSSAPQPCSSVGDTAPFVASTSPAPGATGVSPATTVSVTFSEAVNAAGAWFAFSCTNAGNVAATVSGGPTTFVLTPPAPLPQGDSCQVQIFASAITDVDAVDPPDQMAADKLVAFSISTGTASISVHDVQGATHRSPLVGQLVNVGPAVVTARDTNGFYMQEPTPDGSDATSEGLFVFTSTAPTALVGDSVTVRGTVSEFRPGCTSCGSGDDAFANLTITELVSPVVTVLAHGQPLPAAIVLGSGAGERNPPTAIIEDDVNGDVELVGTFDPATDGIDFFESLEGMRVRIDNAVAVGPTKTFTSGSVELGVLARGGAGANLRTARGGVVISAANYNPQRLILANDLGIAPPSLNVGDSFAGNITAVVTYSFANFKMAVSEPLPTVVSSNLAREITTLTASTPTQLTVASLNVENLDPTDPASKLTELAGIVVNNLRSPRCIALEEVQDNNGATDNGVVAANLTYQGLVAAIENAGGLHYDYRQIDPQNDQDGGEPGGNIRVALLCHQDADLAFVDVPGGTATTSNDVLGAAGAPHLKFSPGRIDPTNTAFNSSRKPLAVELTFRGQTLFVVVNHFNSKGGDQPLYGRFQPPALASQTQRLAQAQAVVTFSQKITALDPQAKVIVLGDLNDFEFAAPLTTLKQAGFTPLIETLPANERYSYVYDANSQALDHILVRDTLVSRTTYDIVHVNAEFAVQSSDHDPSVARIDLGTAPVFTSTPAVTVMAGATFTYQLTASGSPTPTFTLVSGPAGMSLNPSTGLLSWIANVPPGPQTITVKAANGVAPDATQSFTLTVTAGTASAPALPGFAFPFLGFALVLIGARTLRRDSKGFSENR